MFNVLVQPMFWRGRCFGAVNAFVRSMLWRGRCFGRVDVLAQSMFWYGRCFGTVNRWRSRTHAGERQSLRNLKYQPHLYTYCTKTLTTPKNWPHRNTDNAGPKGQLDIAKMTRFARGHFVHFTGVVAPDNKGASLIGDSVRACTRLWPISQL